MANLKNAVPSSLRKQVESSRFAYDLMARSARPEGQFLASSESRSIPVAKSQFARMPQEPEDAKITGVTRSLTTASAGTEYAEGGNKTSATDGRWEDCLANCACCYKKPSPR